MPSGGQVGSPSNQELPPILSSCQPTTDCRNWTSIFCDISTHRIVSLYIEQADLPVLSPLPPAIADIPHLMVLTLNAATNLTGPIPTSFLRLKRLEYITINNINLSVPVPSILSRLKNLRYLELFSNQLTAPIPGSIARIPKLRYLGLDGNHLTGRSLPPSVN